MKKKELISAKITLSPEENMLLCDIKKMIAGAKKRAAVAINAEAVMLYWQVGNRIKTDILKDKRADYGKQVVKKLAETLSVDFGSGWGHQTLRHCVRSAYTFSEEQILYAVRTQLSWTHMRTIMSLDSELKRTFYMEMAVIEHWSSRELEDKINGALYERTALSRKPEELIASELQQVHKTGELTPDLVFKSSYILDFLGLKDSYSETDLEDAILDEIQNFIKELGLDFAFLDRQMRFTVDGTDYKIDLLFYHRTLRRLIAEIPFGMTVEFELLAGTWIKKVLEFCKVDFSSLTQSNIRGKLLGFDTSYNLATYDRPKNYIENCGDNATSFYWKDGFILFTRFTYESYFEIWLNPYDYASDFEQNFELDLTLDYPNMPISFQPTENIKWLETPDFSQAGTYRLCFRFNGNTNKYLANVAYFIGGE